MPDYHLQGRVVAAKVSDLPWPDLPTHFHIEYSVIGLGDLAEADSGVKGLAYEISMAFPREADIETVSIEDGPRMTVPDWMCSYAVGKDVVLVLDDEDEPKDIIFKEPIPS